MCTVQKFLTICIHVKLAFRFEQYIPFWCLLTIMELSCQANSYCFFQFCLCIHEMTLRMKCFTECNSVVPRHFLFGDSIAPVHDTVVCHEFRARSYRDKMCMSQLMEPGHWLWKQNNNGIRCRCHINKCICIQLSRNYCHRSSHVN